MSDETNSNQAATELKSPDDFESNYDAAWSSLILVTGVESSALLPHVSNVVMASISHLEKMNAEYWNLASEFVEYRRKHPENSV